MGIFVSFTLFIGAVIVHEFAHAWMANRLGDPTAKAHGRLTLNPIAHIDPFGTIILPILLTVANSPVLFGWAKPVPVNFSNLGNPKRDMIWVGFAGPGANLLVAVVVSFLLKFAAFYPTVAGMLLVKFLMVNVVLAVFNLIPIPPLDGSRVLMGLAPLGLARALVRMEPYGFVLLFALLYAGLFEKIVWPVAGSILALLLR